MGPQPSSLRTFVIPHLFRYKTRMPMAPERWIKLKLSRNIKKGFVTNAAIEPQPPEALASLANAGEVFLVKVTARSGYQYWISNRRVFGQKGDVFSVLFRHEDVKHVHWIYKGFPSREMKSADFGAAVSRTKLAHGDRLEVELNKGKVILKGLDQAYSPLLGFLQQIAGQPRAIILNEDH